MESLSFIPFVGLGVPVIGSDHVLSF
jgi:hypothetical protein